MLRLQRNSLRTGERSMKTLCVCVGSSCHLKGSYDVIKTFQALIKKHYLDDKIELKAEFCCGNCNNPVSVKVDGRGPFSVEREKAEEFFYDKVLGGAPWK